MLGLREAVNSPKGYTLNLKLEEKELEDLRLLVDQSWRRTLLKHLTMESEKRFKAIQALNINQYHLVSHLIDHHTIWDKDSRIFAGDVIPQIRAMPFMKKLEAEFGPLEISSEEMTGHEEIYWRLVRPFQSGDIGPLHADKWFWEANPKKHNMSPEGTERVKIWIPLYSEVGKNGLRIIPGSHKRTWNYQVVVKGGVPKPHFESAEAEELAELMLTPPGTTVVFHDELIHGGMYNAGNETRVSVEFTMYVKA